MTTKKSRLAQLEKVYKPKPKLPNEDEVYLALLQRVRAIDRGETLPPSCDSKNEEEPEYIKAVRRRIEDRIAKSGVT